MRKQYCSGRRMPCLPQFITKTPVVPSACIFNVVFSWYLGSSLSVTQLHQCTPHFPLWMQRSPVRSPAFSEELGHFCCFCGIWEFIILPTFPSSLFRSTGSDSRGTLAKNL